MKESTQKTINRLKIKASSNVLNGNVRMPSIKAIHEALEDLGIKHWWWATTNTVEHRSAGRRYVNSRHDGKKGYEIKIENHPALTYKYLYMDTSDSYYSWNSHGYARELLLVIKAETT